MNCRAQRLNGKRAWRLLKITELRGISAFNTGKKWKYNAQAYLSEQAPLQLEMAETASTGEWGSKFTENAM